MLVRGTPIYNLEDHLLRLLLPSGDKVTDEERQENRPVIAELVRRILDGDFQVVADKPFSAKQLQPLESYLELPGLKELNTILGEELKMRAPVVQGGARGMASDDSEQAIDPEWAEALWDAVWPVKYQKEESGLITEIPQETRRARCARAAAKIREQINPQDGKELLRMWQPGSVVARMREEILNIKMELLDGVTPPSQPKSEVELSAPHGDG